MVPHMSGTSLDAQARYASGTKAILESYLTGKHDYRPEDLIVSFSLPPTGVCRLGEAKKAGIGSNPLPRLLATSDAGRAQANKKPITGHQR
jgi:hypothetical protein